MNRFRTFFSNSHRSSVLRFQSNGIPAVRWNSTETSVAKKEMSSRKKFGLVIGGMIVAFPGIWYSAASNQDRRKAKVTVQGVGRFIRYVIMMYFPPSYSNSLPSMKLFLGPLLLAQLYQLITGTLEGV